MIRQLLGTKTGRDTLLTLLALITATIAVTGILVGGWH